MWVHRPGEGGGGAATHQVHPMLPAQSVPHDVHVHAFVYTAVGDAWSWGSDPAGGTTTTMGRVRLSAGTAPWGAAMRGRQAGPGLLPCMRAAPDAAAWHMQSTAACRPQATRHVAAPAHKGGSSCFSARRSMKGEASAFMAAGARQAGRHGCGGHLVLLESGGCMLQQHIVHWRPGGQQLPGALTKHEQDPLDGLGIGRHAGMKRWTRWSLLRACVWLRLM